MYFNYFDLIYYTTYIKKKLFLVLFLKRISYWNTSVHFKIPKLRQIKSSLILLGILNNFVSLLKLYNLLFILTMLYNFQKVRLMKEI